MVVGQNVPVTVTLQGGAQVRTLMRVYGAQSQP
jgi:hypothetical protein